LESARFARGSQPDANSRWTHSRWYVTGVFEGGVVMADRSISGARHSSGDRRRNLLLVGVGLAAFASAGVTIAQTGAGTAVYWMTAETTSGMGSMMSPGGANPMAMMQAMRNANVPSHRLQLQLGTGRRPAGEPNAEHMPPPGLGVGQSLPLLTPRTAPVEQGFMGNMPRPRGRMLIYWGCGDRARAGQPVVVDFASMAAGNVPPAFASVRTMTGPGPGRNATYGEWPNQRSQVQVPASGSLVGPHVVRGNYTPEIRFSLAPGQDFLAPVVLTGNKAAQGGAVPLTWQPVPGARAWFVSTMGSARNGDVILWSSSESQAMPMMVSQVSPDEIARLVQSRVLLPADASRCTVPAEVAKAAQSAVLITTAFGPEANFSHPARPARAPASWRPEWTVKLLTRSTNTGLLGMDISDMMRGESVPGGDEDRPRRRRNPLGGLGF
jgi:hypothetical protein